MAIDKTFDTFVKPTQSHTSNFATKELNSPFGLDLAIDEDQSTRSGSCSEENHIPMSPTSPMGPMMQGEYDVGFTVIDEVRNNVFEFRHTQQQTTKVEPSTYSSKNIKLSKKKSSERKINVAPNIKEPSSLNCNSGGYSSLKFGDAFGTKKETFLKVREHPINGPYVEGLIWKDVKDCAEMERLIEQGATNRTTHATDMNEYSSRSHALCTIKIIRVSFLLLYNEFKL